MKIFLLVGRHFRKMWHKKLADWLTVTVKPREWAAWTKVLTKRFAMHRRTATSLAVMPK